jgi:hypothetical protein
MDDEICETWEAIRFKCLSCGEKTFLELPPIQLAAERAERIYRAMFQLEDDEEMPSDWSIDMIMVVPELLKCEHCGALNESGSTKPKTEREFDEFVQALAEEFSGYDEEDLDELDDPEDNDSI